MAHPGSELAKFIKDHGGRLVKKDGHHETWELEGKQFRIATAGKRPTHVFQDMKKQAQGLVQKKQERERIEGDAARHNAILNVVHAVRDLMASSAFDPDDFYHALLKKRIDDLDRLG